MKDKYAQLKILLKNYEKNTGHKEEIKGQIYKELEKIVPYIKMVDGIEFLELDLSVPDYLFLCPECNEVITTLNEDTTVRRKINLASGNVEIIEKTFYGGDITTCPQCGDEIIKVEKIPLGILLNKEVK